MTSLSSYIEYGAQSAKVGVMKKNLLKREDYMILARKQSVRDAAAFLKYETAYSSVMENIDENGIHRGMLERMLMRSYVNDFVKLSKFAGNKNKDFFELFYIKLETDIIKKLLRKVVNNEKTSEDEEFLKVLSRHITIDAEALARSKTIEEFLTVLADSRFKSAVGPILKLKEHQNIFSIEMMLDMYYFRQFSERRETLSKDNKALTNELIGAQADLLNLLWIFRSKKYFNLPPELIYSYIIPNDYKLKKDDIIAFTEARNEEEFFGMTQKTIYKDAFRDIVGDYTDRGYTKYIYKLCRKLSGQNPFSVLATISYLEFKTIEISNITSVIEGIRYGLAPEQIMEYVVD